MYSSPSAGPVQSWPVELEHVAYRWVPAYHADDGDGTTGDTIVVAYDPEVNGVSVLDDPSRIVAQPEVALEHLRKQIHRLGKDLSTTVAEAFAPAGDRGASSIRTSREEAGTSSEEEP